MALSKKEAATTKRKPARTAAKKSTIGALLKELSAGESAPWIHYLFARTAFRSDSELAEELGVNRSSVARWKQGQPAEAKNREMLINLNIVVSLLTGYLESDVIPDWLSGINPMLADRRPIDVLHTGRLSEVVAAIEAERSGAYA